MSELTLTGDVAAHRQAHLDLVAAAKEAYARFVFDDMAQARRVQAWLLDEGVAEYGAPWCHFAVDGSAAGLYAAAPSESLRKVRLRAAARIWKSPLLASERAVLDRMAAAGRARATLLDGDFYLSVMAVAPDRRRAGVGRFLMHALERDARASNRARIVLEVSADNRAAIDLYSACGFDQIAEGLADDPDGRRSLRLLHLAKVLTP